jgi:hypothetical protein
MIHGDKSVMSRSFLDGRIGISSGVFYSFLVSPWVVSGGHSSFKIQPKALKLLERDP